MSKIKKTDTEKLNVALNKFKIAKTKFYWHKKKLKKAEKGNLELQLFLDNIEDDMTELLTVYQKLERRFDPEIRKQFIKKITDELFQ